MVKVRKNIPRLDDGDIDVETWLAALTPGQPIDNLIRDAVFLSRITGEDITTPHNSNCFEESLEIAEIVARLNLGKDAIAAALVFNALEHAELTIEDISEQLGKETAALVVNIQAMQSITRLQAMGGEQQIDNIRKMLLAMVRDVRAVVIKLAERVCVMRALNHATELEQQRLAEQTAHIYAPLASRLGIYEIKWELEDLSFSILHSHLYKTLSAKLKERRLEREARVQLILSTLQKALSDRHIEGEVMGRAKHIYSIYRKMQRKNIDFEGIYDAIAVRVLVPTVDDCYKMLSFSHENWQPIPIEFDDYIATPKPNGYQSIHTALTDDDDKTFELQIRTFKMHEESEMGVAAHWMYKEGTKASGYEEKIKWLRQLLDWQTDLSDDSAFPVALERNIFEDRVYVFTPDGKILDLPNGSTPLDFAYHVHTDIGHRCRGAKINGHIKPLTYPLTLGDTVEILTTRHNKPSRDWIIPQRGYLKTPRARAKVLSWFKKQEHGKNVEHGREMLEKELQRLSLGEPNLEKLAHDLHKKNAESMLAGLGRGDLRLTQVLNRFSLEKKQPPILNVPSTPKKQQIKNKNDISICGAGDLLTHVANCCHPVPGDDIIGYITQGHGVTVHRKDCKNAQHLAATNEQRMIEVDWANETKQQYPVNILVDAYDRPGLINDVSQILLNEKISIRAINSVFDAKKQMARISLTINIGNINELGKVLDRIHQLPNVCVVSRGKTAL
jgi:GTP pyrophosphokinase